MLGNDRIHNWTLGSTFCSCTLFFVLAFGPFCSENKKSVLCAVHRTTFPQVTIPLFNLSPIDLRLAGALQLVKEGSIDWFRVQESGGRDLPIKLTTTALQEREGFSSSYQILSRGPISFSWPQEK